MTSTPRGRMLLTAMLIVPVGGCAHLCCKPVTAARPIRSSFAPPPRIIVPPVALPPVGVDPSVRMMPPGWRPAPDSVAPRIQMYPPEWRAVPDTPGRTGEPPLATPDAAPPRIRLLPPESTSPRDEARGATPAPAPTPRLPEGIADFAMARDRVASGLRPLLDGLDWLQANNYRTVLHLRAPGQDDSADRREVEKRGLTYLRLEVAPNVLTRNVLEEFNRTVTDATRLPLFVYDKDGRMAGALWYLHFRTVEKLGDEAARTRALALGLRGNEANGEDRLLWLAIQKVLSEVAP